MGMVKDLAQLIPIPQSELYSPSFLLCLKMFVQDTILFPGRVDKHSHQFVGVAATNQKTAEICFLCSAFVELNLLILQF